MRCAIRKTTKSFALIISICALIAPAAGKGCDDANIVAALREHIICNEFVKCTGFGLSYQQVLVARSGDIRNTIEPVIPANPLRDRVLELIPEMVILARDTIEGIQIVPLDYKSEIRRYECRASVQLNVAKYRSLLRIALYFKFFSDRDAAMLWTVNRPYAEALFEGWYNERIATAGSEMIVNYGVVNGLIDVQNINALER